MKNYYHLEKSNRVIALKNTKYNNLPLFERITKHLSFLQNKFPNEEIGMTDYKIARYYRRANITYRNIQQPKKIFQRVY